MARWVGKRFGLDYLLVSDVEFTPQEGQVYSEVTADSAYLAVRFNYGGRSEERTLGGLEAYGIGLAALLREILEAAPDRT